MLDNWKCDCGFDLEEMANDEAVISRIGAARVHVTCPACETIYTFRLDWIATVRPEPVAAIVAQKA